ncbi:MAG: hypothetical protein MHM6MM_001699 [Cercozoa sp. M6MM]
MDELLEALETAELGYLWGRLRANGVTLRSVASLTLDDFERLGISSVTDRQRMFAFVRQQKLDQMSTPSRSEAVAPTEPMHSVPGALAFASSDSSQSHSFPVSTVPSERLSWETSSSSSQLEPSSPVAASFSQQQQQQQQRTQQQTSHSGSASASSVSASSRKQIRRSGSKLSSIKSKSRITVAVRKRPLLRGEIARGDRDIIATFPETSTLTVFEEKEKFDMTKVIDQHQFTFDHVFGSDNNNLDLYRACAQPLVQHAAQGGQSSIFAYGQTGSGKTHTMCGEQGEVIDFASSEASSPQLQSTHEKGLYALAVADLFELLRRSGELLYVTLAFYEIYSGSLFDLLNGRKKLRALADEKERVVVQGLLRKRVENVQQALQVISHGLTQRSSGSTAANADSSRSHALIQVQLWRPRAGSHRRDKLHGGIVFVDLAGSERGADTFYQDSSRRREGAEINRSLLALKECIRAMDQSATHLPFRGSKLTQVLKPAFAGDSRSLMLANVAPADSSCDHTLNTLRYADRVKELHTAVGKTKDFDAYMPHGRKKNVQRYQQRSSDAVGSEPGALLAVAKQRAHEKAKRESQKRGLNFAPPLRSPDHLDAFVANKTAEYTPRSMEQQPQQQQQQWQEQQQQQQQQQRQEQPSGRAAFFPERENKTRSPSPVALKPFDVDSVRNEHKELLDELLRSIKTDMTLSRNLADAKCSPADFRKQCEVLLQRKREALDRFAQALQSTDFPEE